MLAADTVPILIVDDRPENLIAMDAILDQPGLSLVKAQSGNEALRLVLRHDFALVLLDVQMPDMDGFETAELLRINPKTRHIPIIFVTAGMKDLRLQFKGYELGAVDYMMKPFEPVVLKGKVRVFCELYRQRKDLERYSRDMESMVSERTARLKASEAMLLDVERTANVGGWIVELASRELCWTEQLCHIHELAVDSRPKLGESLRFLVPESRARFDAAIEQALNEGQPFDLELQILTARGTLRWVHVIGRAGFKDGVATTLSGTCQEITERKTAETRLKLAASVFLHAREGIAITDADANIVDVNDTFCRITGYSRDEAMGHNHRFLQSGRHKPEFYAEMWRQLAQDGHWSGEIWNRRKDGDEYAELLTISAVHDATGKVANYVALFTDITPMKTHQQQLEHIAHYDALTNLPNRVLLADRLQQAIAHSHRRAQSLAVVYLDLDGFKAVNDNHGHDVGDALLVVVAQRMKAALREGDTLARLGGDEFVAVLVDLNAPADCEPVIERLLQAAADPMEVDDAPLRVSASIGVTLYPQDGGDADMLLRHADQAMYLAKQSGKNRYHLFDVANDEAINTQRESLDHVRRGLDQGEFVLYYQPKVNMKSGEVLGVEALIRWQHPQRGVLLPAAFLPTVEDHPISVELGLWVIAAALAQMTAWRAAGMEIHVSVNIGSRLLRQGDFVARLTQLLAAHPNVKPQQLELEILETSALEDIAKTSKLMYACRALGVGFALDDFGTGYSSLTYLKHLPAEQLKIDQTFVLSMLGDTDDLAIVEAVVGLATAFRRGVIAEGVETVAHGELLLRLGCDHAQGFGIAVPMPANALPAWVGNWRPDAAWTAWQGRSLNRDDLPLVFAEVEHRHRVNVIELFLDGDGEMPPPQEAESCRFGLWKETEGRSRYGGRPGFPVVCELHERVHDIGRDVVELHTQGHQADARARLAQLRALSDQLIDELRRLLHASG